MFAGWCQAPYQHEPCYPINDTLLLNLRNGGSRACYNHVCSLLFHKLQRCLIFVLVHVILNVLRIFFPFCSVLGSIDPPRLGLLMSKAKFPMYPACGVCCTRFRDRLPYRHEFNEDMHSFEASEITTRFQGYSATGGRVVQSRSNRPNEYMYIRCCSEVYVSHGSVQ